MLTEINLIKNKFCTSTRKKYLLIIWLSPLLLSVLPLRFILYSKSICIWKNLLGFDCIGCGITKSILLVFHLEFSKAYDYNKLVFIVLPILLIIWTKLIINFKNKNYVKE